MATTAQQQIRNAVHALLAGLAGGRVDKGRARPLAEQDASRVYVYWDSSMPERAQLTLQPDDWMTRVRIEVLARPSGASTGEDVANDLAQQAYALVAADPGLGGLCMDAEPKGLRNDANDDTDEEVGRVQVVFDYRHRTPATSITA